MAHRIRLAGPWEMLPLQDRVRFIRRFGAPTNLAGERVLLVLDQVPGTAEISLNQQPLGVIPSGHTGAQFDIGRYLAPRNQLTIVASPESASVVTTSVCLEIKPL